MAWLTEIKLTLLNYYEILLWYSYLTTPFSWRFFRWFDHCSLCLSKFSFFSTHFVDLVIFKSKTRSYVTRGTQKVVPGRQDKVFKYKKKLSRLPGLPYLPRWDNSGGELSCLPETSWWSSWSHIWSWFLFKWAWRLTTHAKLCPVTKVQHTAL